LLDIKRLALPQCPDKLKVMINPTVKDVTQERDTLEHAPESATKSSGRRRIFIANPVVSIIFSVLLTIALKVLIEKSWPYLTALWNVWWFITIGTMVVALIGRGLFLFRKYYQMLYGASEVGFALAVISINLGKVQKETNAASWIAIVAAAYLIVRGFINLEEGKKKRVA
jgi:hypothetical protein